MRYQIAQHSLRGGRVYNEDRVGYVERDNAVLMVLGDGLGGHRGGALAAEILVRTALHAFRAIKQAVISKPSVFLALTIMQAHRAIIAFGKSQTPPINPRTTCVLCLVQNGYAYWAHVGDSRLYHFRRGRVLTRTRDDTNTEQLHIAGVLTEEEMLTHPDKSRLLKCLGGVKEPSISLGQETRLYRNDALLLCSDGLWEAMPPTDIARYMQSSTLELGVEDMLHDAEDRRRSAGDNLSAVCLRWEDSQTSMLPSQPNSFVRADEKSLREEAKRQAADERIRRERRRTVPKPEKTAVARQPEPRKPRDKKPIDTALQEIESFLQQHEKSKPE